MRGVERMVGRFGPGGGVFASTWVGGVYMNWMRFALNTFLLLLLQFHSHRSIISFKMKTIQALTYLSLATAAAAQSGAYGQCLSLPFPKLSLS